VIRQRDTYFNVASGGLKLREQSPGHAHLIEVDGLGTFIELEAVAPPESDLTREHALVRELREAFAITDARLLSRGYADQLLGRPTPPAATSHGTLIETM
jgi:adenylate cyclase class IV